MKKITTALLLLPVLAYAEGIDMRTCRPMAHKGIGVGNNNYTGDGCLVPVQVAPVEIVEQPSHTTVIIIREPSSEAPAEDGPSIDTPSDYGE